MLEKASWQTLLAWIVILISGIASWQLTLIFAGFYIPTRWWNYGLAVMLIEVVLSFALFEGLYLIPINDKHIYRLAFFLSAAWGSLIWFQSSFSLMGVILMLLGCFVGSLLATHIHLGFWENNYPPPDAISDAVYEKHRKIIGKPARVPLSKRLFDVGGSMIGLLISIPIWIFCLFVLWLEDPGPLFFVKNSVGKGGRNFHQYKLRTMIRGAEVATGPVMAAEEDTRTLKFGRVLRKTALDEIPQLINILRGDMSFVGPRPQRTVLVYEYLQTMPEFAERHRVLPGLAGLAQVAGNYYISPRQKLRYDRIYTRNVSLGFDLKLIALAFTLVFYLRWKPDSTDRIPRNWLH